MWQGDVLKAARFYPLGPALFAGTLLVVGLMAAALVSGRTWRLQLEPDVVRALAAAGIAVLAVSWMLKLVWLGN
jgi:hypothetical protein